MSIFSGLFQRRSPEEQLVADVLEELKARGIADATCNHEECTIAVGRTVLGLRNLFLTWRLRNRVDKAALVKRFLDAMLNIPVDLGSIDAPADKLLPIVRSRSEICLALLENLCAGAPDVESVQIAWAPFVGDLARAVALDLPDTVSQLSLPNIQTIGFTWATAYGRAMENLRKLDPPMTFIDVGHPAGPGLYHSDSVQDYQSSMLLLPERAPQLPQGEGDVIAMVPGRNSMWITGSRNEAGISALLEVAERSLRSWEGAPHRCSTTLLRLSQGEWTVYVPETNELKKKHRIVSLKQAARDYGCQKTVLEKRYDRSDESVFVASYTLVLNGDSAESGAAWSSGVSQTFLPRVDVLGFVEQILDPATGVAIGVKRMVKVAWDHAIPVVKDLMEEVPHLYPPRYRVTRFPDESALAELGRRGTVHEPSGNNARASGP